MIRCPECGSELEDMAAGCGYCGMKPAGGVNKRRDQADLLLKIGAIIFIFGIFAPIIFVAGGVIFGAGAIVWLMSRQ